MLCKICGKNKANQSHHAFIQSKKHREIYGKLIDAPFNKIAVCSSCNTSHANIPNEYHWDEKRFRAEGEFLGYVMPQGTKSYQQKWGKNEI